MEGGRRRRERGREGAANGGVSSEVEAGKGKRGAELGMHGQEGEVTRLIVVKGRCRRR